MSRARAAAAVVAVVVALVPACASIPTDSEVISGGPAAPDRPVREVLAGPAAGATPVEVVTGFVEASPGAPDEYGVARTYLTTDLAERWQPESSTVVFAGVRPTTTLAGEVTDVPGEQPDPVVPDDVTSVTASVAVDVVATVDGDGRYLPAPAGSTASYQLTLVRQDGQWRIDDAPDLVLVSDADFSFQYREYPLWFIDPTGEVLVPESRWLPSAGGPTATRVVAELLQGPSPWLVGAVTTAVPGGTSLAPPRAVTSDDGTTVVELTSPARRADGPARAAMRAQLAATLQPLLGETDVELRVDGAALDVPESAEVPGPPAEAVGDAVLVDGTSLLRLSGESLIRVERVGPVEGLGATNPAVSVDATRFAVLTSERSELRLLQLGTTTAPEVALTGADLTAPSIDRRAWTWSTSAESTGTVTAVDPAGEVAEVVADWLAGRRVTSLRVSRDGTRAVTTSTGTDGVASVDVAGVVRDERGRPLRLEQAPAGTAGGHLVRAAAAAWSDADEVAVLGSDDPAAPATVHVVALGGPLRPARAPVADVTRLAAGLGTRSLLVATADGTTSVPAGSTWRVVLEAGLGFDPAYPG